MTEPNRLDTAFPGQAVDLYGEAELMTVLERNREQGIAPDPEQEQAASHLGQLMAQAAHEIVPLTAYDPEVIAWGEQGLAYTMSVWSNYSEDLLGPLIGGFEGENTDVHLDPELAPTIARLYEAKQALLISGEQTVNMRTEAIESTGDTMQLVLVPWQAFKDNLDNLPNWLEQLQGVRYTNDDGTGASSELLENIQDGELQYCDPADPFNLISIDDYLNLKIQQDGPWGVMLMQTSASGGAESFVNKTIDTITDNDREAVMIAGVNAGSLGIFEWLALNLQQKPHDFSEYSVLPANRLHAYGKFQVITSTYDFDNDRVCLSTMGTDVVTDNEFTPRLAVG